MKASFKFLSLAAALFALPLLGEQFKETSRPRPTDQEKGILLENASLVFETNLTDSDAEIVLRIKAPEGLRDLNLVGPDGRIVFLLKGSGRASLDVGFQQFVIESAEPDIQSIMDSFPEGNYYLGGHTLHGLPAEGVVNLSHALPSAPVFSPKDGDQVSVKGAQVAWKPVLGASAYVVEIENDELGFKLVTRLPASVHSFHFPDGFLLADTEYDLGVGCVGSHGNVAVAEASFTTTP